jgi:hypothetical protein
VDSKNHKDEQEPETAAWTAGNQQKLGAEIVRQPGHGGAGDEILAVVDTAGCATLKFLLANVR